MKAMFGMRTNVLASIILSISTWVSGVLIASALAQGTAAAQTYPVRPITIIVPFAAGGPTDVLARVLGEHIRADLGQPVLIENVTGAGAGSHIGGAFLANLVGAPLQFVPYRGTAPAMQDLVAGQIDLIVDQAAN